MKANADPAVHSYIPPAGFIPDSDTAKTIAEAVLIPIYGKDIIEKEKPLVPVLKDGIWTVKGTMLPNKPGGVAIIEISKQDGRIIRVSHGK